ncbi:hypothetical protein M514_12991 [Trichuris suis]|uniref:Integrase catalytic domain-containing protein n=1 Tax=Trichuris suis TaxID=68888 RepID=A0A085N4W9_9BILA|nr:hypothetical protein M513_12991 [Trichuris suis]KFD64515.1 hypothetical protein M514_12991 [Trichuris suis]
MDSSAPEEGWEGPLPYDNRHPITACSASVIEKDCGRVSLILIETLRHRCLPCPRLVRHKAALLDRPKTTVDQTNTSIPRATHQGVNANRTQLMAELPIERLAGGCPPFHHKSVGYFGPIEVMTGRNRHVRRYGVIFTCLTIRAVFLDAVGSLSTEDFLLMLRPFISLHGKPESIYSDNGRNFVRSERDLRHDLQTLNNDPAMEIPISECGTFRRRP